MTTYLALLRGINVSGQNLMPMAKLQQSLSGLGFEKIKTYLQSGNMIFEAKKSAEATLAATITNRIKQDFGYEVPVLVVPHAALTKIANANPLWPNAGGDEKLFHCTFLFQAVTPQAFQSLTLPAAEGECAVLLGQTVLLHCPHGYGITKLNNNYFERALKVPATTRNWRTVLQLQALGAAS